MKHRRKMINIFPRLVAHLLSGREVGTEPLRLSNDYDSAGPSAEAVKNGAKYIRHPGPSCLIHSTGPVAGAMFAFSLRHRLSPTSCLDASMFCKPVRCMLFTCCGVFNSRLHDGTTCKRLEYSNCAMQIAKSQSMRIFCSARAFLELGREERDRLASNTVTRPIRSPVSE